jgi:hypothetical protein
VQVEAEHKALEDAENERKGELTSAVPTAEPQAECASSLLVGGRIDADAVVHRSRAEQATVDHTAFLPDQLLVACFQRVVVRRPKLPSVHKNNRGFEEEEEDAQEGDYYVYGYLANNHGLDPLTLEIYNLPWDGGANHLRALSATCIRWRAVAAPLLLPLIDALRFDAEALVVDSVVCFVRPATNPIRALIRDSVQDGHRACLLAEGIKWGGLALCEHLVMCTGLGPVFGIAFGRALRSNPLGRLRHLALCDLDFGHENLRYDSARIADSGMVALCDALVGGALPVLEYLDLSGNDIGNPGAIALGAAASRVGVLEHCTRIKLDFNPILYFGDFGALCLALWMGGLPLVREISCKDLEKSGNMISKELDQLVRSDSCGQRPFVGDLAVVELMKALSDRLAKELRRAAMAPLSEGTACLVRLEEAWQEDGPAVLDLLWRRLVLDENEQVIEYECGTSDQLDQLAGSTDMSADMNFRKPRSDILPDAAQLRSSTRGRGRKGRRGGRGRGGTHGRQGGTLQGHAD